MFILFLGLLITVSSLFIVVSSNTIYSILFLMLVFLLVSLILILLNLNFLALMLLIVYIGAIVILFLFVVMMLNIKIMESSFFQLEKQIPMGICLGVFFLVEFSLIIFNIFYKNNFYRFNDYNIFLFNFFNSYEFYLDIQILGSLFYVNLFFFLIIGSILLLLAMLSAIALTLKKRVNIYSQKIFLQIVRDFNKTITFNNN